MRRSDAIDRGWLQIEVPRPDGYAAMLDMCRIDVMLFHTRDVVHLNLIQNEQTKLTATALNNVAVAFVIAGFVGPLIAYGFDSMTFAPNAKTAVISISWLLLGLILHLIARLVLAGLKA